MKNLVNFFHEIGKLKGKPRRGWVLIGVKNPASITDHSFRTAIMAWVLGRKKGINIDRTIRMALIHDICELYAGDITPYDHKPLPKNKKEWSKLFDCWPRFTKSQKFQNFFKKHKKEKAALIRLTSGLGPETKKEILNLWYDYESGTSKEARFVRQINRAETLLQAFEYSKEIKKRPYHSWWIGSQEQIDDPLLREFMSKTAERFYHKPNPKNKK